MVSVLPNVETVIPSMHFAYFLETINFFALSPTCGFARTKIDMTNTLHHLQ